MTLLQVVFSTINAENSQLKTPFERSAKFHRSETFANVRNRSQSFAIIRIQKLTSLNVHFKINLL